MRWIAPKYSRNKVREAGRVFVKQKGVPRKKVHQAFDVLLNWRSAHAYPMHSLLMLLRQKAPGVDPNAVVVQRLKRLPSIVRKLIRFGSMSLDRMQDIGGCRAVVDTVDHAERLRDALKSSRTRNVLVKEYDYIRDPKNSGYRGIHLVYRYGGTKQEFRKLLVEVQLRSKIQHSWATAVEVVDTFTDQSLKTDQGSESWKRFFRLVSVAFSDVEGRCCADGSALEESIREARNAARELRVVEALRAYAVSTKYLVDKRSTEKNAFFLLLLDTEDSSVEITSYSKNKLTQASEQYLALERQHREDSSKNVVLVEASSIVNLKKAYPNYFADTEDFVALLKKVIRP